MASGNRDTLSKDKHSRAKKYKTDYIRSRREFDKPVKDVNYNYILIIVIINYLCIVLSKLQLIALHRISNS